MVYEDPITKQKPEGKATLVRFLDRDDREIGERWMVRFIGDREVYARWV
jgi:hypothetical protein